MAQNKKKNAGPASPPPAPAQKKLSTAGQSRADRIAKQKAREENNKKLRAQGLPTPHEIAVKDRKARRALEKANAEKAERELKAENERKMEQAATAPAAPQKELSK